MEANRGDSTRDSRRIWLGLIGAVVVVAGLAVWMSWRMAAKMSAAAGSDEQAFATAEPGSKQKVVLEITKVTPSGAIEGWLLEKKTEEVYVRTSTQVAAQSNARTKVVMGKQADIRAGAVAHLTGTVRRDRELDAEQIVILTGYVRVE